MSPLSLHLVWLNESSGLDGFLRHFLSFSYQFGISFLFWFCFGWLDDFIALGRSFFIDLRVHSFLYFVVSFVLDFGLYYFSQPCIAVYLKKVM